ncbi:MAG: hypothetical protein ACRECT_04795 [Thermoplasmata archaeon]
MPGAPNRPPETAAAPPPVAPLTDPPEKKVLRRLAPARIALLLDPWKGAVSAELLTPFDKAEAAFSAGDYPNALSALDLLSVRFAEPRWPTLPEPFRFLRVPIPAPMPPHWDPDHALAPAEREAKRARRVAGEQLALAAGSVGWAGAHSLDVSDLTPRVEEARVILEREGPGDAFYERIDAVWEAVRARAPRPKTAAARPAPAAAAAPPEAGEA